MGVVRFENGRDAMGRPCRGMVMVAPDRDRRPALRESLDQRQRTFGIARRI